MWPTAYREWVTKNALIGREFEIPESDDLSGVGASLELLDEAGAASEADEFYPGLIVKADGFVPIGSCTIGTGDPYFINVHDAQPGLIYRIYHDSVLDNAYDRGQAIARVLNSYEELLRYLIK